MKEANLAIVLSSIKIASCLRGGAGMFYFKLSRYFHFIALLLYLLDALKTSNICVYSKLVSTVVSTFTAYYIHKWSSFFPSSPLEARYLPTFDGRAVLYPSVKNLRDYMSWRQADCMLIDTPKLEQYLAFPSPRANNYISQAISITYIIRLSGLWSLKVG